MNTPIESHSHPNNMTEDNNDAESDLDDDPGDLYERLERSLRRQMKKLEVESEKLQNEKDAMNAVVVRNKIEGDDLIKINAGGKIIHAMCSTLCLAEGSVFSNMFSGRWDKSQIRDEDGCVFLDHDPGLIEAIINYLREKKIEDPSNPSTILPDVSQRKVKSFKSLLEFWGLTSFFYIDTINFIQFHSNVAVTKNQSCVQLIKIKDDCKDYFVASSTSLDSPVACVSWKVTINELPSNWLFLGIIGNLSPAENSASEKDSTSYGWSNNHVFLQGQQQEIESSKSPDFTTGDCLHFHFQANKLTMFSVQKNRKFVIDVADSTVAKYIYLNTYYKDTKLTLKALNRDELRKLLESD